MTPMARRCLLIFGLLLLAGCSPESPLLPAYHGDPNVAGSVARVEHIGAYSAIELRILLWAAKLPDAVPISNGTELYRISYWSHVQGKPVLLSGLMGVPDVDRLRGTVLYMHGTNVDRGNSVSNPSFQEGVLVSGIFAGGGYLHLAPDLLGLGISHGPQPYVYTPGTVEETLDFLHAAQIVCTDVGQRWNANIYVTGFSQGGHAAAIIQRELEQKKDPHWHVRAGAGIAGPYDVANIEFPLAMTGASDGDPLYLSNLALSYSTYYHQPLGSILKAVFATSLPLLLDGDHAADLDKRLPSNPRELFTQQFLTAFDNKQPHWFLDAMRRNEAYAWAPLAPFRAYYGDKDRDVAPANAKFFAREASRRGGHVQAVPVGPQDHTGTVFHAIPMIRRWFDQLSSPSNNRP